MPCRFRNFSALILIPRVPCVAKWKSSAISYFSHTFGVSRWGRQEGGTEMLNDQEKLSEKGIEVTLSNLYVMDPGF